MTTLRSSYDKIRTAVRIQRKPFTMNDIWLATGCLKRSVRSRLWDMEQAGEIRVLMKRKNVNVYVSGCAGVSRESLVVKSKKESEGKRDRVIEGKREKNRNQLRHEEREARLALILEYCRTWKYKFQIVADLNLNLCSYANYMQELRRRGKLELRECDHAYRAKSENREPISEGRAELELSVPREG